MELIHLLERIISTTSISTQNPILLNPSSHVIDSWYDAYLGVIILVRDKIRFLKKGMKLKMIGTKATYQVEKCGFFTPKIKYVNELKSWRNRLYNCWY